MLLSKKSGHEKMYAWNENKHSVVLTKSFTITIPHDFRQEFGIGQEVIIYLKSNAIIIKKKDHETIENQAVISRKSSIYIPKEIRTLGKVQPGTEFVVIGERGDKLIRLVPYCS
ncbi:hypothetical protein CFK37_03675 [Virgibacillus phasianinus]|uniref:SpoVT-AbrB domain-containing protein n=1 Tax=Virgibacillus phasianinus TaxID=2017483 RepID=A0A220TZ83_9BACI|nr:AbrB/MazE/SpoVT family DNA-binding domain-containing protein [Virgibacillus phasianinus]ASK61334.1 hypothetical protein CFK37_03675 [Virgibacillus phasianinus]